MINILLSHYPSPVLQLYRLGYITRMWTSPTPQSKQKETEQTPSNNSPNNVKVCNEGQVRITSRPQRWNSPKILIMAFCWVMGPILRTYSLSDVGDKLGSQARECFKDESELTLCLSAKKNKNKGKLGKTRKMMCILWCVSDFNAAKLHVCSHREKKKKIWYLGHTSLRRQCHGLLLSNNHSDL